MVGARARFLFIAGDPVLFGISNQPKSPGSRTIDAPRSRIELHDQSAEDEGRGARFCALTVAPLPPDFFTVEVLTLQGLVRYYVLFVIDLRGRRVEIAGIVQRPFDA